METIWPGWLTAAAVAGVAAGVVPSTARAALAGDALGAGAEEPSTAKAALAALVPAAGAAAALGAGGLAGAGAGAGAGGTVALPPSTCSAEAAAVGTLAATGTAGPTGTAGAVGVAGAPGTADGLAAVGAFPKTARAAVEEDRVALGSVDCVESKTPEPQSPNSDVSTLSSQNPQRSASRATQRRGHRGGRGRLRHSHSCRDSRDFGRPAKANLGSGLNQVYYETKGLELEFEGLGPEAWVHLNPHPPHLTRSLLNTKPQLPPPLTFKNPAQGAHSPLALQPPGRTPTGLGRSGHLSG